MTSVRGMLDLLRDTDEVIDEIRRRLARDSSDELARLNLATLEKRRRDLIRRLDHELHVRQNDLVRYEINRAVASYPAKAVAESIMTFQDLVTAVFDALRTAPKRRYRPAPENVHMSTMEFAVARSGSVLISLSVPNERLLLVESDLDRSFDLVCRLLKSRSKEELREFVGLVGIASISRAYAWAGTNAAYSLDTVVRWGKRFDDLWSMEMSRTDAQTIRDIIEATSEEIEEELEMRGILVGFDADTSYFHLKMDKDIDLRGGVAPGLSRQWTTDMPYQATLLRTTHVKYATGEEIERWTLLALKPLPDAAEEDEKTA